MDRDRVSLREYLELQIRHERELREASEKARDAALELVSAERLRQFRGDVISRAEFDTRVNPLERQSNRWAGGTAIVVVGVSAVAGLLAIASGIVKLGGP